MNYQSRISLFVLSGILALGVSARAEGEKKHPSNGGGFFGGGNAEAKKKEEPKAEAGVAVGEPNPGAPKAEEKREEHAKGETHAKGGVHGKGHHGHHHLPFQFNHRIEMMEKFLERRHAKGKISDEAYSAAKAKIEAMKAKYAAKAASVKSVGELNKEINVVKMEVAEHAAGGAQNIVVGDERPAAANPEEKPLVDPSTAINKPVDRPVVVTLPAVTGAPKTAEDGPPTTSPAF
ncbi:MAG TPA: hypothetical protein VIH99_06670 [Bdellovibrionota bacterium]|jgi:hypothetical protein